MYLAMRFFWPKSAKNLGQAKALRGFGSAGTPEIVGDYDGNTYRAIYTVQIARCVFVLHVFQKKSKHGIATPKADMHLIEKRMRIAEQTAKEIGP
jgi:phage-related protein